MGVEIRPSKDTSHIDQLKMSGPARTMSRTATSQRQFNEEQDNFLSPNKSKSHSDEYQCSYSGWVLGRHSILALGLIPGCIGGAGIFIEHPSRRGIDLTLFISLVTDLYIKLFQDEGFFTLSLPLEQLIFTTCSSCLLYCLRSHQDSYTVLWPFTAHKLPEDLVSRKYCPHKGDCLGNLKQKARMYFCYGLAVQLLKITALHFKKILSKPSSFLNIFFKQDNLRLPLFASLYVTLFQGVSCLLLKLRGQDDAWHALPAGFAASFCYLLQPNFSLALLAFSNLLQIVCRKYRKNMGLPAWHWGELVFLMCMGLLYHARAAYPKCFPSYMTSIMDLCTDGRAKTTYDLVDEHLLKRI